MPVAAQPYSTARPPLIGPGHAVPDDEEPAFRPPPRSDAPPRIEGPGDAHDWPWNRRSERFPDEIAPQPQPPGALTPPSPFPATPDPMPRYETPVAAAPDQTAGNGAAPRAAAPPPPDEPKGPPRKGWWKRLTE